jgi:predicted transcriptional regulator
VTKDRKKNNYTSTLADTDVLLDVLGNETRRRILNLISHEPMYFNQLAKEIRTGQQAILRHVKILEDSGLSSGNRSDYRSRCEIVRCRKKNKEPDPYQCFEITDKGRYYMQLFGKLEDDLRPSAGY